MKEFTIVTPSGFFFTCKVFPTKAEMDAYYLTRCNEWGMEPEPLEFAAMVSQFSKDADGVMLGEIGEVICYAEKLGAGLISHEMLHCAFWHERLIEENADAEFGDECGEDEERICYTLTELVRQFVDKCYDFGIFK